MNSQALAAQPPTTVPTVSKDNIPYDLKQSSVFCLWLLKNGKKVPIVALTGRPAHTNDLQDFCSFDIAYQAYQRKTYPNISGIGRLLHHSLDSIYAIDLDKCVDGGILNQYALDLVRAAGSYSELSPSSSGIRIFGRAPLPAALQDRCSTKIWGKGSHPVYDRLECQLFLQGQYVTCTGNQIAGSPNFIADNEEFLLSLLRSNPAKVTDYFRIAAAPALRPAAARKKQSSVKPSNIEEGTLNAHQTNSRIRMMRGTSAIFLKNWFKRADKSGKTDSEYQCDLVEHAYVRYQMSKANLEFVLGRWCTLNGVDYLEHRLNSWIGTAQAALAAAQANGRLTYREHETTRKRTYRAQKNHTPTPPPTVGLRDMGDSLPKPTSSAILDLVAKGKTRNEIAAELGTTPKYVKTTIHRNRRAQKATTAPQPVAASKPAPDYKSSSLQGWLDEPVWHLPVPNADSGAR